MITTSLTMIGAACRPMSPVIGSMSWSSSSFRSTRPPLPKLGTRAPVFASSADHLVARCHVDDPLDAAVGPVRQSASGQPARRLFSALSLVLAVDPQGLAGCGVEGHDRASRPGGGVEHAPDHQRRGLEIELGRRAEIVGLEAPRHFERVEVAGVDLIERRVPRAREVGAVGAPLGLRRGRPRPAPPRRRDLRERRRAEHARREPRHDQRAIGVTRRVRGAAASRSSSSRPYHPLILRGHRAQPLDTNFCTRFPS